MILVVNTASTQSRVVEAAAAHDAGESRRWATATHLLDDGCHVDAIQETALRDGAYFAGDVPLLFSAAEAREFLRGKRLLLAGDSYERQHFIGLVEVLTGKPSDVEITPDTRSAELENAMVAARTVSLNTRICTL